MADYRELTEFFNPDLHLPINGVVYRVKCPGRTEANRLRELILDPNLTVAQEQAEISKLMGGAEALMTEHDLPDTMVTHAGRTALMHFGGGPEMGRANWELMQLGTLSDLEELARYVRADLTSQTPAPAAENNARG